MIVHLKEILSSLKEKQAVGAFNTSNLETTIGIVRAAVKTKTPVIVQISEKTISYAGLETIFSIIKNVAESEAKNIPIAIHLDHGRDPEIIKRCIAVGINSIQIDASDKKFNENVLITKKIVSYGHSKQVFVQGELGSIFGHEGMTKFLFKKDKSFMTDPDEAKEFVDKTKVDSLAVSIGTMHGNFKGKEKIDFKRLTEITKNVKKPLVLHGSSGVKSSEIRKAIKLGIKIINVDTDLRIAFTTTLQKNVGRKITFFDPRIILKPSIEAVQKIVEKKILLFNK